MDQRPPGAPRSERRRLSHVDRTGRPRMVDVSAKPVTARRAVAEAPGRGLARDDEPRHRWRRARRATCSGSRSWPASWAPSAPASSSRSATRSRSPTCVVAITPDRGAGVLRIRAEAATTGQTGVEMEAMTAASVAALTVYDMVKGVERGVEIGLGPSGLQDRRQERRVGAPRGRPATPGPGAARPRRRTRRSVGRPNRPKPKRAGGRAADEAGARPHGQRRGLGRRSRGRVGRRPRGAADGARVRGGPRARPGRRRGHRGRARAGAAGHDADRHDRRHRPHASRRDAAGDRAGHRLRGARAGGGDAGVRPRDHAARRPVARRSSGSSAGRSSSTSRAARRAPSNRSTRSSRSSTTRSRRWPARSTTARAG